MGRGDVLRMVWRRARMAGIETELGCHSFRAMGITIYLKNGGLLEHAQQMAAHESTRTTKRYDRRNDQVTLDEVEKLCCGKSCACGGDPVSLRQKSPPQAQ